MKVHDLPASEYANFYAPYVQTVSDTYTLHEELEISLHRLIKFMQHIPLDKFDFRYAEGKWTIKEILQHLLDTERIFAYRALRFARKDNTELPGYDENAYANVVNPQANKRKLQDMLTEFTLVRQATLALFQTFSEEDLKLGGTASQAYMSVRAIGFIIIGHQNHHLQVFETRYINK